MAASWTYSSALKMGGRQLVENVGEILQDYTASRLITYYIHVLECSLDFLNPPFCGALVRKTLPPPVLVTGKSFVTSPYRVPIDACLIRRMFREFQRERTNVWTDHFCVCVMIFRGCLIPLQAIMYTAVGRQLCSVSSCRFLTLRATLSKHIPKNA
jgi:hypothetical protein